VKEKYAWEWINEKLHKKIERQMDEIKKLNEKSETIFDLARKYPNKTYVELEKYRDADRVEEAIGIGHNQPPKEVKEAQAKSNQLQDELDRVKKDNNDLFLRIAELTEVEESHRNMNGKIQERLTEVEEDNKKLSLQIEDQLERARKAGL